MSAPLLCASAPLCHPSSLSSPLFSSPPQSIEALDRQGMQEIESLSPENFQNYQSKFNNTICGRHPIAVLLNALRAASAASQASVQSLCVPPSLLLVSPHLLLAATRFSSFATLNPLLAALRCSPTSASASPPCPLLSVLSTHCMLARPTPPSLTPPLSSRQQADCRQHSGAYMLLSTTI
eukprot:753882-Hanusia_phi.AAC.3